MQATQKLQRVLHQNYIHKCSMSSFESKIAAFLEIILMDHLGIVNLGVFPRKGGNPVSQLNFLLPLPDHRVHPGILLYLSRVHRLLLLPEVLASVLQ